MLLNKEAFLATIAAMEQTIRFDDAINEAGREFSDGYYVDWCPQNCVFKLADVLEAMFDDKLEVISWFCFELNFGKYYGGEFKNVVDGEEYPLNTAGALYDYLIMMRDKNKERDTIDN